MGPADMDRRAAAYMLHLGTIIDRRGHVVQAVLPDGPGDVQYAYTIGLQRRHGLELIVCGLAPPTAMQVLNNVADMMDRFGRAPPLDVPVAPPTGEAYTPKRRQLSLALLEDFCSPITLPVTFRRCRPALARGFVLLADKWHGQHVDAVQLVLPDAEGRFPEDPEYDDDMMARQPVLYGAPS